MLRLELRLDVDGLYAILHYCLERCFDPVTSLMDCRDCLFARDHKMKLDERRLPSVARA